MTIAESLSNYFRKYPLLKNGYIDLDYLKDKPTEYSIFINPGEPIMKQYIDGSSIRQMEFVFCSNEFYEGKALTNIENSGFYEQLEEWVEKNNRTGILPEMKEGCTAQKVEPVTYGYMFENSEQSAQYQIQFRLIYFKGVN